MAKVTMFRTLAAVAALVAVTLVHPATSHAGTAPNLLDSNFGWVLPHPKIHNVFWDDNWDAHNPAFTRASINHATAALVSGGYLNGAAQYGVGSASFTGSNDASFLCGSTHPAASISSAALLAWLTCEVVTPFTGVPYPDLGAPVSNSLYVFYLPRGTTIADNVSIPAFSILGHTFGPYTIVNKHSCADYGAYHFLSFGATSVFAFAIVPANCAGSLSSLMYSASHEIVESATDPVINAGWINDSISIAPPNYQRLLSGEAADECGGSATLNGVNVATYWSNARNLCVAH